MAACLQRRRIVGAPVVADDDAVHAQQPHVLYVLHQVRQLILHLRGAKGYTMARLAQNSYIRYRHVPRLHHDGTALHPRA